MRDKGGGSAWLSGLWMVAMLLAGIRWGPSFGLFDWVLLGLLVLAGSFPGWLCGTAWALGSDDSQGVPPEAVAGRIGPRPARFALRIFDPSEARHA